jgi:NAD(P)H-dependent FMN reductase
MKVMVLNGSPKGALSVTFQYLRYLIKHHAAHDFTVAHVSQQIDDLINEPQKFEALIQQISQARCIIWATPVYCYLVPAQLKQFIELLFQRQAAPHLEQKYAAVISSSSHFFDHAAQRYLHAICDDLGLHYLGFFSAEMYDLLKPEVQTKLGLFADSIFSRSALGQPASRHYAELIKTDFSYHPRKSSRPMALADKKAMIVSDATSRDPNLQHMIHRLRESFFPACEHQNLH